MQRRSYGNLGQNWPAAGGTGHPSALHGLGRLLDLERLNELIKETRYSVCQLRVRHFGREPLSDFEPAPVNQISSVGGEKFVQHFESLRAFRSPLCAVAYTRRGGLPLTLCSVPHRSSRPARVSCRQCLPHRPRRMPDSTAPGGMARYCPCAAVSWPKNSTHLRLAANTR